MGNNAGFDGRKVLVISPRFFGYEQRIIDCLVSMGAEAVHVDDRPANTPLTKALIRINPRLIQARLDHYHQGAIESLKGTNFDDVLIISPEGCGEINIAKYKAAFPQSRFSLYMWDALKNKSHKSIEGLLALFDETYSFDQEDCRHYGMGFRPLFFSPSADTDQSIHSYDFSFIGTLHSDRYAILKTLRKGTEGKLKSYIYPYLSSQWLYWLYKLTKVEFWGVPKSAFRFEPLPYPEVMRVMRESMAILDIEHPGQNGLTMRTMEVLGAGKKLITTNQSVADYPFYSPQRVFILDRANPIISEDFFLEQCGPLPEEILASYSLSGWLQEILPPRP